MTDGADSGITVQSRWIGAVMQNGEKVKRMTREEAIKDIQDNILPIVGGKSLRTAIEALQQSDHIADGGTRDDHLREVTKKMDVISRQKAITQWGK
jgi:hypothetical protein